MITALDTAPYVAGALGMGGVGAWLSRRREIILRWCTWAVTAPVVGGALYLGAPGAAALAAGIAVGCALEYGRMVRLPYADRTVLATLAGTLPVLAWLVPHALPRLVVAAFLAMACVPVLSRDTAEGLRRLSHGVLGLAWLAPLTGLVLLGPAALPLFLTVSIVDVAAFCGGKLVRGPHLSPFSPAKRWSGVAVGALVGVGVLAVLGTLTVPFAVAVVLGAPLGDLLESLAKRGAGVKDAGGWLPGFGGLFDRVDSLLVALTLAVVLSW